MTNYSELFVVFLMIPVFMQIFIPLLMLIAFGVIRGLSLIFGRQRVVNDIQHVEKIEDELQLSRS